MKIKNLLSLVTFVILLTSFIVPSKSLANWAYKFVVWDGYIYVVSDEYVKEIDTEIGHVTKYSDIESSYSGNFSNTYEKGTKYYSIKGISSDETIAIEESDGRYIKANREGKYKVRSAFDGYFDGQQGIIKIFIFLMIGIVAIILIYKVKKNNR
jgi:uncharacterized protein YdaL